MLPHVFVIFLIGPPLIAGDAEVSPSNLLPQNATGRSLFSSSSPPSEITLGFISREIGLLECTGIDHLTGGTFFERLMGKGADASGNYLCQPTCGGDCVPNQEIGLAPSSLYPFGCRCNRNRCNAEGPIVTHFGSERFKIICVWDTRCTCDGMGHDVHHVGYLCNWINLNTHRVVSFLDRPDKPHLHPTYSPIRWCSCCPQERITETPTSFPPPTTNGLFGVPRAPY